MTTGETPSASLLQVDRLGDLLDHVELLEHIGGGSHSAVFRGRAREADVTAKFRRFRDGSDRARRFRREAGLLATLDDPAFPDVFEIGHTGDIHFTLLEFIDGDSLRQLFADEPMEVGPIVQWALQLVDALRTVHDRKLVHRDIKPENILFESTGRLRLIDFGLVGRSSTLADRSNDERVGTLQYAAPEQIGALDHPTDQRSDLYALGVVLYEALAGERPFEADEARELVHQHATVEPEPLSDVPGPLADLVDDLLQKDPDDRPRHAREVADRLAPLAPEDSADPEPVRPPDLAGRNVPLQRLRESWRATRAGGGSMVILRGRAGVGKSECSEQFARQLDSDDAALLTGRCAQSDSTPLAPIRSAVSSFLDGAPESRSAGVDDELRSELLRRLDLPADGTPAVEGAAESGSSARQFYQSLVDALLALADACGGAVLLVDDLHWADDATFRVVRELADRVDTAPLLFVGTDRTDAGRALDIEGADVLDLKPLETDQIQLLVERTLGNDAIDARLVDRIAAFSNGLPFLAVDYLFTLIDAGRLEPNWGAWQFDPADADALELPDEAIGFVVERLERVDDETRRILRNAAVLGRRLELPLLVDFADAEPGAVREAVERAIGARILEQAAGEYRFVHERLREALLESISPRERRQLHQRAAQSLGARRAEGADRLHRAAGHFLRGTPDETPREAFDVLRDAGFAALDSYAFAETHRYLDRARGLADDHDFEVDVAFLRAYAEASAHTGRLEEARREYERAADRADDPIAEAEIRADIAEVHLWDTLRTDAMVEQLRLGLGRLGARWWDSTIALVAVSLVQLVVGVAIETLGWGQRPQGRERRRLAALAELLRLALHAEYWQLRPVRSLCQVFRGTYVASRLGVSPEQVRNYATASSLFGAVGTRRFSERFEQLARRAADEIDTPQVRAYVDVRAAWAHDFLGSPASGARDLAGVLDESGHWLETGYYTMTCGILVWNLAGRGYADEAVQWLESGLDRVGRSDTHTTTGFLLGPGIIAHVQLGRFDTARRYLDEYTDAFFDDPDVDPQPVVSLVRHGARAALAVQTEDWELLEDAIDGVDRFDLPPQHFPIYTKHFFIHAAYGRLSRIDFDAPSDGAMRRADAMHEKLERAASSNHPSIRTHERVVASTLAWLRGDVRRAADRLDEAERLALEYDSKWGLFEVYSRRARRLAATGSENMAHAQARAAYQLAREEGWQPRIRRLRARFPDLGSFTPLSTQPGSSEAASDSGTRPADAYLDALLRVSLAASRVSGLDAQIEAVLREAMTMLGAERGLVWLTDDNQQLQPSVGLDDEGEPAEFDDFSDRVVERVRRTRQPLLVRSTDDADERGLETLVDRDIRSVAAVPLSIRDEFLGVMYLDNRLARGVFGDEELDLLKAFAQHIPGALQAARSAELETEVRTEREQRELANFLRESVSRMSSTLSAEEILATLLESVVRQLPVRSGWCGQLRDARFVNVVRHPRDGASEPPVESLSDSELLSAAVESNDIRLLHRASSPQYAGDPALRSDTESWLAAPLSSRTEVQGVVVLESPESGVFDEPEADVLETLARQAGVALQNAELATRDPLTDLYNRRYFFDLADREFDRFLRYETTFAVALLDLDDFKAINDEHGHQAGDHVLESIAAQCRECCRTSDIVGRYGGEEFVLLLPETGVDPGAERLAERLRTNIAETSFTWESAELDVTASLGLTESLADDDSFASVVDRADRALYEAKRRGRNRVVVKP